MKNKNIPKKYKFIIYVGKTLHAYGVQSYKIQSYLSRIAQREGIKGSFMDSPTWINYVFFEDDDQSYNYTESVPPGDINLGALAGVVEITDKYLNREIGFTQVKKEIEELKKPYCKHYVLIDLIAYLLAACGFCVILEQNWTTIIIATFVGGVVYLINYFATKSEYVKSVVEALSSFVATIIIGVLSIFYPHINISLCILSAIIVPLPGLYLTTALEEITSNNLISGTAKFFGGLICLFKLFFGVMLGLSLLPLFIKVNSEVIICEIPFWINSIAVVILAASLSIVFRIRKRDFIYSVIVGYISFTISNMFVFAGIMVSMFIGTLAVVFMSQYFSRWRKTPKLVFLNIGLVMLVPGSKAFIVLSSFFIDSSTVAAENMWLQVFYIIMGIVGGLLFSGSFMNKNFILKRGDV